MTLDWAALDTLAAEHGESFFVLSEAKFRANFEELQSVFLDHYPKVRIGYSYKTNYTPHLCRIVHELGGFAEVVSEMEYALAERLDVPGERIIFNGPYKAESAFRDACLGGSTLNLDSARDLRMLRDVAADHPQTQIAVVVRTNFALNESEVSRFGMDVDGEDFRAALALIEATPNLRLKGLHCHFPDRDLASFEARAHRMAALTREVFGDELPEVLNIGGGYFSHMPESLLEKFETRPASFRDYGKCIGTILSAAFKGHDGPWPTLFLEPGTAIVADTQCFYTRVIDTKIVRNRNFATVAGSGFDISPTARSRSLPVSHVPADPDGGEAAPFDVVGYTCIEKDILSGGIVAPIRTGDFLRYDNVGSYSVVMRPPFILPANPVLLDRDGALEVAKARQTNESVFRDFVI